MIPLRIHRRMNRTAGCMQNLRRFHALIPRRYKRLMTWSGMLLPFPKRWGSLFCFGRLRGYVIQRAMSPWVLFCPIPERGSSTKIPDSMSSFLPIQESSTGSSMKNSRQSENGSPNPGIISTTSGESVRSSQAVLLPPMSRKLYRLMSHS